MKLQVFQLQIFKSPLQEIILAILQMSIEVISDLISFYQDIIHNIPQAKFQIGHRFGQVCRY